MAASRLENLLHLPEMQIDTNVPVTTNAASLSLRVRASDAQYPLDRLNVFLNDVPVFGTAGIAVADRTARSVAQDIHLRLKAREAPQPRFCWHCRKPLHARSDRCPFCGEGQ